MSAALRHLDIFELRPLITNLSCKLSAVTSNDAQKQLLCLVSEENDIVLRYISESGQEVLKLISWFRRTNHVIHDVSFDPAGNWLLVLCFDNTLHIVPALAIVDKVNAATVCAAYPGYSTTQITSYIIPFVGPHECPNSKKCPNHSINLSDWQSSEISTEVRVEQLAANFEDIKVADENEASKQEAMLPPRGEESLESSKDQEGAPSISQQLHAADVAPFSHDLPSHMLASNELPLQTVDATGNSHMMMATSFMASKTCPYPLSVVWWRTNDGLNRAIIGYSDGSICFVGLSPNCPFVASTAIESGTVMKLLICKDNTFDSVMLLITSSLKQQYKLLLEQRAIKYVYPGDISPSTSAHTRENDWQIVMPLHGRQSNCSDPASDNSQLEEDVFVQQFENPPMVSSPPPPPSARNSAQITQQIPPPPPYSVAITRHLQNVSTTNTTATDDDNTAANVIQSDGSRFHQPPVSYTGHDGDNGILPTARARLASLKSLGSKKLQAIKMRLSDNRQKLDEFIPESSLGSFAIMDSPSVTPEPLGQTNGSFYTIQNLRSTYLLSALHTNSNSLSVHSIDINLKPLFLYKIPQHCLDILISSNILYAIRYVDINISTDTSFEDVASTEKERRDTDVEKVELMKSESDWALHGNSSDSTIQSGTTTTKSSTENNEMPSNAINAVSVISSAMASLRTAEEDKFNSFAELGLFRFEHETVLNLYQMATYRNVSGTNSTDQLTKEEKAKAFEMKDIHTPMDYVQFYESTSDKVEYSLNQMEIMQNEFPKINYDPCYVVTNKNVYYIQLKKEAFAIFLDAALASEWLQCRDFCNTFDLSFEACIEFAGDYLLRRNKVTQALLTYNMARVKPIRTALKLAMHGHTYALMQLCAMALKSSYILRSKFLSHPLLQAMLTDITYRHSEDVRLILPETPAEHEKLGVVNEGASYSDYNYAVDESISALQMSPSSQFHLANLLLITLAEKAVNDKNYIPLWNFLVTNSKYHTNMTSIVLCQSGLFSSALILAKVRGVCLDTFLALTSVVAQEFGWYTEINVCLYNLSEELFAETITYLPQIAVDYFMFVQERIDQIRPCVLRRLAQQLNPFSAVMRPIVSHTSTAGYQHLRDTEPAFNDNNIFQFEFCKTLVETYLAVLIHMESQRVKCDCIINALSNFRITYEDNQFAIETSRFKPISAGCAHCACVVDGVAYFWGSNGVPCHYSVNKSSDPPEPPHAVKRLELLTHLNLEVHAVKCGRQHSLVLTNNGLYAMGNNNLYQLGIGKHMQMSLQPMLLRVFDGKNVTILEAGQYHNAAVANGQLYTWGWGVYGQLGHGNAENVAEPKLVSFFKYKKILQVSLGHAHSLVLCETTNSEANNNTELYVFGSNNFGQLGIDSSDSIKNIETFSEESCSAPVKSVWPVKLHVSTSRIRLIHTKFFTNLVVDEDERMFTWGSSPQALRLANQIKRRANAKQKLEEYQQREMSKRFEATMNASGAGSSSVDGNVGTSFVEPSTSYAAVAAGGMQRKNQQPQQQRTETKEQEANIVEPPENPSESPATRKALDATEDLFTLTNEDGDVIASAKKSTVELPKSKPAPPMEAVDPCEHMSPHLVDTTEVAGQILQVSSGLFHFALISSTCTLYTWGKNLEHQLGTEDKDRRPVNKPSPIDSIERPMFVDCGADFTLVMTTDYIVKAFGGNSNGQCGRDLGASLDRMKQRVVCLPTTKRLMRFESQCVEAPVEINLPRPCIRLDNETVRYLKCMPRYQPHFMQEANINFCEHTHYAEPPSLAESQQYKSSSEVAITGQDSDDLISSLDNLSNNDISSLNYSYNAPPPPTAEVQSSSYDCSPDEQSYAPLPEHRDQLAAPDAAACEDNDQIEQSTTTTSAADKNDLQPLRHYIHYCLYVFHGLYNPDKIRDFSKLRLEYRIRTLMLNFKFIEAFQLCLQDCDSVQRTLKIFEYFSKDTGYVPLRRQDLKYLIYHLCLHFLARKFDLLECERFFLADLDYYLLELAYVLYFNNNNSLLEQNLNEKFKILFEQNQESSIDHLQTDSNNQQAQSLDKLQDTDIIFDSLSVKFKTIICQRLLKYCSCN